MLSINKQEVSALPEVVFPGRVIVVDNASAARSALAYLMKQREIGFDTETRPTFRKGQSHKVCLLQLSTADECFLFRLNKIGFGDGIKRLLEAENIAKIGLSIKDDFNSLHRLAEFTPGGFVELQTMVKEYDIADNSLQRIYAIIFGQRITKGQRLTNWEAETLTDSQKSYAAIDAWACMRIYDYLRAGMFDAAASPYRQTVCDNGTPQTPA